MYKLLKRTALPSGHRWPTSVRSLNSRIKKKAGWFWDNVTHQAKIDLRRFGLEGVNSVEFTFVDPLFVFLQQCDKLVSSGYKLVWDPCVRKNPNTGVKIYGAGIECGLLLRAATNSIPAGSGRAALLNLSWDGGNTGATHDSHISFFKCEFVFLIAYLCFAFRICCFKHKFALKNIHLLFQTQICFYKTYICYCVMVAGVGNRSACPIHVQVMNTNCGDKDAVGLVGYMPVLEVSEALKETKEYANARFHVMQECIGLVLERIEVRAKNGFTCSLDGQTLLLFPRVGAMSLDTKERTKYFGQRSDRTCSFCRLRNGRSTFRGSKRQDPDILQLLFRWATLPHAPTRVLISQRARARATLRRHGWNHERRCRLPDFARECLVHVPEFPKTPFGALCHFERMHTFFIAYCDYFMDLLVSLVLPEMKHKVNSQTHLFFKTQICLLNHIFVLM